MRIQKPLVNLIHFISLTDVSLMPDCHYLGQYVDERKISWPHTCVPECQGYDADNDSYLVSPDDENEDIGYWDD